MPVRLQEDPAADLKRDPIGEGRADPVGFQFLQNLRQGDLRQQGGKDADSHSINRAIRDKTNTQ